MYSLGEHRGQTAGEHWGEGGRAARGRHRYLLASDIRRHHSRAAVDWPAEDGHTEAGDCDRSLGAAQMADAGLEEEDHSFPGEDRSYREVVNCTGLGEGRNSPAEDHIDPEEGLEGGRRSFHSRSQSQGLDPEGNLLRHRDAAQHRSVLGQDNQTWWLRCTYACVVEKKAEYDVAKYAQCDALKVSSRSRRCVEVSRSAAT